jgi:hypothetical protein
MVLWWSTSGSSETINIYQNFTLIERPFAFQSSQGHRNGTAAAVFCSTASVLRLANAKRWCRKWSPIRTIGAMRAMMGTPLRSRSRAHQCRYKKPGIWQGIHRPACEGASNGLGDRLEFKQRFKTNSSNLANSSTKWCNIHLQASWQVQLSQCQCPADEFASCRLRLQNIASCENCLKHWPRNPRTAGTVQTPTLQCICTGIGAQQLSDCFQPFAARISELTQREKWRKPDLNMSRSCMMQEAPLPSECPPKFKNPHGISPLYPHYWSDYGGPTPS